MTPLKTRIRWEQAPDTGAPSLSRAEAERVFAARTGLDPYDLVPLEAKRERAHSDEQGPTDHGGNLLAVVLMAALDGEARSRCVDRSGRSGRGRGRPELTRELRWALAEVVRKVGGPANAALFIWLHGLEQSTAHVLRPPRDDDDARDTKATYELLTKRLDVIAREAASLPAPTQIKVRRAA